MCRLHAPRRTLHTQAHRAGTCEYIKRPEPMFLRLLGKLHGFGEARLKRIRTGLASDPGIFLNRLTFVPRSRGPRCKVVPVVKVLSAKRSPQLHVENKVVVQNVTRR